MKILFISDVYFPRVNGVSTSIETFRHHLRDQGHTVHLIAPDYGSAGDDEAEITRVPSRRIPFDLPEAESELISGYFTEYSAMKQGVFMLSEFIEIAVIGALFVTLFFGGYNLPWMNDTGFVFPGGHALPLSHGWVVVLQLLTFLGKVFLLCSFQILVRWTLPRFRWDQLLRFAWKFLLPLAIANLVVTAVALWAQQA